MKKSLTQETVKVLTLCPGCDRLKRIERTTVNGEEFRSESWVAISKITRPEREKARKACPDLNDLRVRKVLCPDCAQKQPEPVQSIRQPFFMSLIAGARKLLPFRFSAAA